jgi:hypothetical protein
MEERPWFLRGLVPFLKFVVDVLYYAPNIRIPVAWMNA